MIEKLINMILKFLCSLEKEHSPDNVKYDKNKV